MKLPKQIRELVEILKEKHAKDIVVLNLSRIAVFTDYFIVCTAESFPQVKAIAEETTFRLPFKGYLGKEGFPVNSWVLLDYGDFILHIFLPEARNFYALEKVWADAPSESIKNEN